MGRVRTRKETVSKEINTSNQNAALTTDENSQSLADHDTRDFDVTNAGTTLTIEKPDTLTESITAQGTRPLLRRSGRLNKSTEDAVPSNADDLKEKEAKNKKVSSSARSTERNSKQGTSNENADPSADFKSLYMAARKRAEELEDDNRKLKKQVYAAQGRIDAYEKMLLKGPVGKDTDDHNDTDTTNKDTPNATATTTATACPTDTDATEKDTPGFTAADDGHKDSA